jgi:hypothetical protein
MNLLEFWAFAKDCKFVSKNMSASHLEAIFEKTAIGSVDLSLKPSTGATANTNTTGPASGTADRWLSASGLLRPGTSSSSLSMSMSRTFSSAGAGGAAPTTPGSEKSEDRPTTSDINPKHLRLGGELELSPSQFVEALIRYVFFSLCASVSCRLLSFGVSICVCSVAADCVLLASPTLVTS